MNRHRPAVVAPAAVVGKALGRNVLALAVANGSAGVAFLANNPGSASSLLFMAKVMPLPLWGAWFLLVALLLGCRSFLYGHTLAVPIWLMWGLGAVLGLASGASSSPTGSIALTGMVLAVTGMHCGGLVYRRDERAAIRAQKTAGGA